MNLLDLADRMTELYLKKLKMPKVVKWLIAPEVSLEILKILLSYYHKVKDGKEMKKHIDLKKIIKKKIKKVKPALEKLAKAQPYYRVLIKEAKRTKQPQVLIDFLEKYKNSTIKEVRRRLCGNGSIF